MASFSINWDQFKPSTKGGTAMPTPSPAPVYKPPAPSAAPKPLPAPSSSQPASTSSKGNFLSGGFIQKALDIVSTPYYALAGFNKGTYGELNRQRSAAPTAPRDRGAILRSGISNIIPGIKNRAGFGTQPEDVNLTKEFARAVGKETSPGFDAAGNLLMSLATPSLAVAKIPGVSKIGQLLSKVTGKVADVARKSTPVATAIEKVFPYFRRPEVGKMVQTAEDAASLRTNTTFQKLKELSDGMTPDMQAEVTKVIKGGTSNDARITQVAQETRKMLDQVGQELVDSGLLPAKVFAEKKGNYFPQLYEKYLKYSETAKRSLIPKFSTGFLKKQTGTEGYLEEFAPSVFQRLSSEGRAIEIKNLFQKMADNYGQKVNNKANVPEGFVWASDVIKNEALKKSFARTAIPQDIADYVTRLQDIPKEGLSDKIINVWKQLKTIYNPAYHSRNVQSNQILSDMQTGRGAVRTAAETAKVALGKTESFIVQAAKNAGLIDRKTINSGFEELRNAGELSSKKGLVSKAIDFVKNKPREFQQKSEEISKLQVFKAILEDIAEKTGSTLENVVKDKNFVKQAVDKAEEAIFSPYRISSTERGIASKITPFYSFARQAFPFTVKTLAQNPSRITKYQKIKDSVEDLSGTDKIPVGERTDTYKKQVQLPGKTKDGKAKFWDPTYVLPYGSFDNDNSTLPFGMSINPILNEGAAQVLNYDTYTKKPVTESNIPRVRGLEKLYHGLKTAAPTFLDNIYNKVLPAFRGKPDRYGRERGITQSLLDTLLGFKTTNADPASMKQSNDKSKVYQLRSFQKEQEAIMTDPNLSEKEKTRRIRELQALYSKAQ